MNVIPTSRSKRSPKRESNQGYTLVICEKPDAARRVAEALSSASPEVFKAGSVQAFRLQDGRGRRYVVCAAAGHLYGISDTVKNRRVYPVADLEWFPLGAVSKKSGKLVLGRIRAIKILSSDARAFVNACDLDVEGETIGYNILRYACGGKEGTALRARFSSLTKEEVVRAFRDEALGPGDRLATAGRLRHTIDFLWGINLSRALSEAVRTGYAFKILSVGRVQGPTLNFVVDNEIGVRTFVPTPYWTAKGRFRMDGEAFEARYSSISTMPTKVTADQVKTSCEGRIGVVASASRRRFGLRSPPPFNLADLQKEAFGLFGYAPSKTLQIAERLYLNAMISYPRTGSQRLPKLDYGRLLSKIAAIPGYSESAGKVLSSGPLHPTEGRDSDPAHPAIYPTGEAAKRPLTEEERRLLDLIVRRFISCFGDEAIHEASSAEILLGEHKFTMEATRLLVPGWMDIATLRRPKEGPPTTPTLREGDHIGVEAIVVEERLRRPSMRYNQATLLEKMEREEIGTKATRSEIISTLLDRGYVTGTTLVPTELGFALIEAMNEHCPQIISTDLTREIEAQLERIEASGDLGSEFFEEMLSALLKQLDEVRSHGGEIAAKMRASVSESGGPRQIVLGRCPMCKEGKLWVVRSRKSGKRFVGCTNYSGGCRASAPLPQRGTIKVMSKPCGSCGWPVVYVRMGRYPWKLCVNDRCPRKVNVFALQNLQKHGLT